MRNIGIVCEFNPLHNGHKRILDYARELGAERVVCVMSGNATQRGELAVLDKYTRAKAAIASGADLVLELPYPWSSASAEYFATAGIKALTPYCDAIIFGSECGDIELLNMAAEKAMTEVYGIEPVPSRGGGSIPILADLQRILGIDPLLMGFGLERDTIHSPNESYLLKQLFAGMEAIALFYKYY